MDGNHENCHFQANLSQTPGWIPQSNHRRWKPRMVTTKTVISRLIQAKIQDGHHGVTMRGWKPLEGGHHRVTTGGWKPWEGNHRRVETTESPWEGGNHGDIKQWLLN